MAVTLAFYKGRGTLADRLIRWATRSKYSHIEILESSDGFGWTIVGSSPRDGGVRRKTITPKHDHWDLKHLPDASAEYTIKFVNEQLGKNYDYLAIIFTHVFAIRRQQSSRWLCSELVAHAVGEPRLAHLPPGDLAEILPRLY